MKNFTSKLGIAPINWCNDDMPDLGKDYSLHTCFTEMREAGYQGTELGHKFPQEPHKLKKLLDSYQLHLASAWHSTYFCDAKKHDSEHQRLEERLKFLQIMGTTCINLAECTYTIHNKIDVPLNKKPHLSSTEWGLVSQGLEEASVMCHEYGITPAYHNHMGTVIQDFDEIKRLMEDCPSLKLCFDSGHLQFAGIDPIKILDLFSGRIGHVHLKDIRKSVFEKLTQTSFLEAVLAGVFTVPGDGCIDFSSILAKLHTMKYNAWIIVEAEQDPSKAEPFAYACKSYKYLQKNFLALQAT